MESRLATLRRCHAFGKFRGADLSGQDIDGWSLVRADLSGANMSHVTGRNVDLCGARMDGALLEGVTMEKWDLSAVALRDAEIRDCHIERSIFVGADLTGATLKSVYWNTNGSRCRGIVLPDFDPAELSEGNDCHDTVAKLLLHEFPEDFEIRHLVEFVLSRTFPCWSGFAERVEKCYPHRIGDLESAFRRYPSWNLLERWQLTRALQRATSLDELMALKQSPLYGPFQAIVDVKIRKFRDVHK